MLAMLFSRLSNSECCSRGLGVLVLLRIPLWPQPAFRLCDTESGLSRPLFTFRFSELSGSVFFHPLSIYYVAFSEFGSEFITLLNSRLRFRVRTPCCSRVNDEGSLGKTIVYASHSLFWPLFVSLIVGVVCFPWLATIFFASRYCWRVLGLLSLFFDHSSSSLSFFSLR